MKINFLKSISFTHLLLPVYLVVGGVLFQHYLQQGLTLYLGILLFPYITVFQTNQSINKAYPILAILLMGLSFCIHAQSLYFLAFLFTFLFLLESVFGRLNHLPLFLVLFLSTIFTYTVNIFTVPIRLELSTLASSLINWVGLRSKAYGNLIYLDNQVFAVDTACIGLNMLSISLILTTFFLAHFDRENKTRLPFFVVFLFLFVAFLLNVFSNLFRIIVLVVFQVLPTNPMHDAVGLLCLVTYVVLPSYFLTKFGVKKLSKPLSTVENIGKGYTNKLVKMSFIFPVLMLILIPFKNHQTQEISEKQNKQVADIAVNGFQKEVISDVGKFTKTTALLYIKPIKSFFAAEHNPMICWIGSGYQLQKIQKKTWQGREIYTGLLVKDSELIHTAWWYEGGNHQTIKQLEWRWQMLKSGKAYHLVNMNTESEQTLKVEVESYWKNRE
jgi:exosortase N